MGNFASGKEVILLGDFNQPSVSVTDNGPNPSTALDRIFLESFTWLGLYQWVTEPTNICSDNIIDLVLTLDQARIVDMQILPPLSNCGHLSVMFSYLFAGNFPTNHTRTDIRWDEGDYAALNHALSDRF